MMRCKINISVPKAPEFKSGPRVVKSFVIAIFVDGTNDHYTRGYNFPIGTTPKKFSVSELGVIFWGSPLFLAVFGH